MVQQVGNPVSLTASSMLSGGSVDPALKASLEMSPAGSAGAAPDPVAAQVGDQHQPEPTSSSSGTSSEVMEPSGAVRPDIPPRDRSTGRFVSVGTTGKGPDGRWRLTSSAGS